MKPITKNTLLILLLFILLATQFFSCKKSDEKLEELIVGEWVEDGFWNSGFLYRLIFNEDGSFEEYTMLESDYPDSAWQKESDDSLYTYEIEDGYLRVVDSKGNDYISGKEITKLNKNKLTIKYSGTKQWHKKYFIKQ